jgi:lipoate-protein ligase A
MEQPTMTEDVTRLGMAGAWQILVTPPSTGQVNMDFDRATLAAVGAGTQAPTLRFFRWKEPTATFGRLQDEVQFRTAIPPAMPIARRPTGGGLVLHDQDLCLSLCWPRGLNGVPADPQSQYAWIHRMLQEALGGIEALDMLACCDAPVSKEPFETRRCFANPVGSDLLKAGRKIVGGALARQKNATLYQGSIQELAAAGLEHKLFPVLRERLSAS